MRLNELLKALPAAEIKGNQDFEVTGITQNSKRVREGYVFIAIAGTSNDGWKYVDEACARGAVAIVSEHSEISNRAVCWVKVNNAREASADLASKFNEYPASVLRTAGITGTNGKTTTAWMLRDILRTAGLNPGLIGTINYEIGSRIIPASRTTPDACELQSLLSQMVKAGCQSVVMEVSSHALDQQRTRGVDFDVAVFTNLTRDHLDYHKTKEAYFEAKRKLFVGLTPERGHAVINLDDVWGRKLFEDKNIKAPKLTYGLSEGADVRGLIKRLDSSGSVVEVAAPWGVSEMNLKLLGRFNVMNALAALASSYLMGIDPNVSLTTLATLDAVRGRLECVPCGGGIKVFIDYAHTDDALQKVLESLNELKRERIILVFGCGGNRDKTKRPAMGRVAAEMADFVIVTSDNPRNENPAEIIREITGGMGGFSNFETIEDRREAIAKALKIAKRGDIVLIAGKGHETFQEAAGRVVPFDDRQVAAEELRKLGL